VADVFLSLTEQVALDLAVTPAAFLLDVAAAEKDLLRVHDLRLGNGLDQALDDFSSLRVCGGNSSMTAQQLGASRLPGRCRRAWRG